MSGNGNFLNATIGSSLRQLKYALSLLAVVSCIYLATPILIVFAMSLTKDFFLTWPPNLFSTRWFSAFFDSRAWMGSLGRSLAIAVPVAALSTVLGTLAALGLTYGVRQHRALRTLFVAPLVLPIITYALGLFELAEGIGIMGSVWPVVIGQTMLASPLVFIIVSAGLAGRNPQLPQAAASLGAPAVSILLLVELPLIRSSIAAASLVAFAYSFDEIIVALFLLPPGGGTLPVEILGAARETADPTIAAASMISIGVAATIGALVLLVRTFLVRRSS